jgi:hypothetical protein
VLSGQADGDRLTINALAGDDAVEAAGLASDALGLTIDGGAGAMCSSAARETMSSWAATANGLIGGGRTSSTPRQTTMLSSRTETHR